MRILTHILVPCASHLFYKTFHKIMAICGPSPYFAYLVILHRLAFFLSIVILPATIMSPYSLRERQIY